MRKVNVYAIVHKKTGALWSSCGKLAIYYGKALAEEEIQAYRAFNYCVKPFPLSELNKLIKKKIA